MIFTSPLVFCLNIISLATTNKRLHLNCKLIGIKCIYFHTQDAHHQGEASYPSDVIFFRLSYRSEPLYGLVGERKRIGRGRMALKSNLITWKGLRQECGCYIQNFISRPGSSSYCNEISVHFLWLLFSSPNSANVPNFSLCTFQYLHNSSVNCFGKIALCLFRNLVLLDHMCSCTTATCYIKTVKLSRYRPGQALRAPGG